MREFLSETIKKWVLPYSKAWAAFLVGGIASGLSFAGLDLDPEVAASLTAALAAFFTWFLPNIPYAKK